MKSNMKAKNYNFMSRKLIRYNISDPMYWNVMKNEGNSEKGIENSEEQKIIEWPKIPKCPKKKENYDKIWKIMKITKIDKVLTKVTKKFQIT